MMIRCAACGHENQQGAKFCSECGDRLADAVQSGREERKVVTVLFADLVGFTSRAELLDPEDVRALLSPYYARLRTELERFGGTVEKFIGDAVMAVFGAPVAHEDDAERAVRAALAIRDWVLEQGQDLQLRIAVHSGEALVALDARVSEGHGMVSGDVVNTAARLQTAAPINGILVSESTQRATSHVIDYRECAPVVAKGKAEPITVWEALQARARLGVDPMRSGGPLIAREYELDLMTSSLARVQRERSPLLVTVVGVPGMGKSRLVAELFRAVDSDPTQFVLWRQGRSLPYGDGVTFWALTEMVKAHAGILDSDSAEESAHKLHTAIADVLTDRSEAQWVEDHLRPLVGLEVAERSGDRQSEAFAAWGRFFEALAEERALTLVFEDLQWADTSLLDFIQYLVEWSAGVPLLVVCTARPELLERRAGWGGGVRNSTTLSLSPLSDDDTARLISSLSERPVLPAETQQALLERAGGNPLYTEQYVRMLAERGRDAEQLLPETVQGIIAARLDALEPEEKGLLQNAAVMGKVFWLDALCAMGDIDRRAGEQRLHGLERKEFVQRARRSSIADVPEYSFLHVLVRDVAYGQIPRAQRAEKHRLAAEWIEALGRAEDHAEMLAHHYRNAVELRRAAGQHIDPAFAGRVLESLREAGARAFSLHAYANASGFYETALTLAPAGSRERALLLFSLARNEKIAGRSDAAVLIEARDELLSIGESEPAAEVEVDLAEVAWLGGDRDSARDHLDAARRIVDGLAPSRATAYLNSNISRFLMLDAQAEESIRVGEEALKAAEQLNDGEVRASALDSVGVSMVDLGDARGLEYLESSLAIAKESGAFSEAARALGNLSASLWMMGQPAQGMARFEEGVELAARYGQATFVRWFRGQRGTYGYVFGRWDESLASIDEFLSEVEAGSPHYIAAGCYMTRALIRVARNEVPSGLGDADRGLELSRPARDPQNHLWTVALGAHLQYETGHRTRASALVDEYLAELRPGRHIGFAAVSLNKLVWTACALGRRSEVSAPLATLHGPWAEAAEAFAGGDLRGSIDITERLGAVSDEAWLRLALARSLVEENRRPEADIELQRALEFYRSVRATRYIREGEALLAQSA
jgi:class 3 adenylate cyclase/tetratricopeptide (TPR) repeat protein